MLVLGLGIINYPFVSQWVNERHQSQVIDTYDEVVEQLPDEEKEKILSTAVQYNDRLREEPMVLEDGFTQENASDETEKEEQYNSLLNPAGDGVMGYVEIPAIDVFLPVSHGTGTKALEQGTGHLYGTSLPVGGSGTHAVLAAHTGIATKLLFTDLDQLKEGDHFYLHIMGDTLAYQVDQILVVTPDETEYLEITEEEDYVTLVTCTPYGINSHRLLVRGTRVPYEEMQEQKVKSGFKEWGKYLFLCSVIFLIIAGKKLLFPRKEKR